MAKTNFNTLAALYADEDAAREYLEQQRWPDGAICPHCGSKEAYKLTGKPDSKFPVPAGTYKCKACRKKFTVRVGTIFEDSHIKLNHWLYAFHAMSSSKKGISAHQLHRTLGITYKSAWFMCHRIRFTMTQSPLIEKLSGIVEVDETYVGGKPRKNNKGSDKQPAKNPRGRGTPKIPVVAAVERDGKMRAKKLSWNGVNSKTLSEHVNANVAPETRIFTDGYTAYWGIGKGYISHEAVNHRAGEYRRGDVHTNTVESSFALLKRGVYGTFHHISEKHLDRYVDEFVFRWNARKTTDIERTRAAIKLVKGKRLMYKTLITDPG